ncbi:MAG: hypothetical protein LOD92_05380, partial [Bacillales bacterium]
MEQAFVAENAGIALTQFFHVPLPFRYRRDTDNGCGRRDGAAMRRRSVPAHLPLIYRSFIGIHLSRTISQVRSIPIPAIFIISY